jgi:uncharacterized membrane protein YjfL (UPF0719 family)
MVADVSEDTTCSYQSLTLAETMVWGAVAMGLTLLVAGILDMYAQEIGPN